MGRKDLRLLIPTLALCFGSGMTLWLCGHHGLEITPPVAVASGAASIALLVLVAAGLFVAIRGQPSVECILQPSTALTVVVALVMMLIGAANALGHYSVRFPVEVTRVLEQGGDIDAMGTLVHLKVEGDRCQGEVLLRQLASSDALEGAAERKVRQLSPVPGRAVASAELDCAVVAGQEIRFHARPRPPYRTGTVAHVVIKEADVTGEGSLAARVRMRFLDATADVLERFPLHAQGLIPGAALGEESMLDARSEMDMKTSGLTHLIAVSGGHIALVLTVSLALVGRKRGCPSALVCVLVLAGLCVLVGLEASVVRALTMAVPIVIAIAARLPSYSSICLAISALLCILFAPFTVLRLGFMLSWVASAAIIFFAPRVSQALCYFTVPPLASLIAVPLVASVATLPLQLLMNGQASVWQVVANILAAPVVAPLTIFGLLGVLFSVWAPMLAGIAFIPASWCTWWITALSRRLGQAWASHLPTLVVWVLYLVLFAGLVVAGRRLDQRYHPSTHTAATHAEQGPR